MSRKLAHTHKSNFGVFGENIPANKDGFVTYYEDMDSKEAERVASTAGPIAAARALNTMRVLKARSALREWRDQRSN